MVTYDSYFRFSNQNNVPIVVISAFFFARTTLKNIWQSVDLTAAMEKVSESYVLVCEQAFEVLDSTSLCCVPVFQLWRLSI